MVHAVLLRGGRGAEKTPGEFRRTLNWIGGSRPGNAVHVPPPPERLMECMGSLELFLHDDNVRLPLLVQLGLIHVQFETIRPFLDGNGRLGRLLITLLLCSSGALKDPLLYLSLYFKTHRDRYYDLLQKVRTEGAWEEWLEFFLERTETTARQSADTVVELVRLFAEDRQRIQTLGRSAASALRVHEYMQKKPLMNIGAAADELGLSIPNVAGTLKNLAEVGIACETTGRQRGRGVCLQSIFADCHCRDRTASRGDIVPVRARFTALRRAQYGRNLVAVMVAPAVVFSYIVLRIPARQLVPRY